MNKETKKHLRLVTLFLTLVVTLSLLFMLRFNSENPVFSGDTFYYDLRVAEDLSKDIYWDYLQDRPHTISFFHYFLSFIYPFTGIKGLIFVSILFGLLSVSLFFLIMKELYKDDDIVWLSCIMLILSPIFIYLFTVLNQYSLATLLSLVFIYLFLRKNFFSIFFLSLVAITDIFFLLINILLLIFYYFYTKEKLFFWLSLLSSIFSAIIFLLFHPGFRHFRKLLVNPSFSSFLTSFGAEAGIAFFYLFLGIIGLFIVWRRSKEYAYISLSLSLIFIFSLFNIAGRIYLSLYLSVLSSILIIFLLRRKWAIGTIKKFTILLIFCGIIFSSILHMDQAVTTEPQKELVETLEFLKNEDSGKVLSYVDNGHFIEFFATKPALTDTISSLYPEYLDLDDTEQTIFHSRNLETTKSLLIQNNIKYVLITTDMKKGLVWTREGEGFLFLLDASPEFEKIHSTEKIDLWKFIS